MTPPPDSPPTADRLTAPSAPFRVIDEDVAFTGRVIRVGMARVKGPDGGEHLRDVMHHPGAVAVVPLHDDGTVTLVHQYRAALDTSIWEIPAGLRDVDGEPPEITAGRELAEEAGLAADQLDHIITFHNSPGHSDEAVHIYLARGLHAVPDDRQGLEEQHMTVARVGLAEALAMVDDGRITDAKTVIGLLGAARDTATRG